jgi:long-chain acyl-CoA synthetase
VPLNQPASSPTFQEARVSHIPQALPRFWEQFAAYGHRPAVLDSHTDAVISYRQLDEMTRIGAQVLSAPTKRLVCLAIHNDTGGILCYLSALRAGHAVCLCGPDAGVTIDAAFIQQYAPDIVIWRSAGASENLPPADYQRAHDFFGYDKACVTAGGQLIHPDLALLLRTSGSTGGVRTVRLSYANLAASVWQVSGALGLEPDDRAALPLPLHYVYGLSVLNTTLSVGGCLITGSGATSDPDFWRLCDSRGVTTLAFVPTQLRLLRGLGAHALPARALRRITLSGASLDRVTRDWTLSTFGTRGIDIYSMYGMAEACGRISVLRPAEFIARPGSVGRAVAGGCVAILASGEIAYKGPNVMLGYADGRGALQWGDALHGSLLTGDLGVLDESGNLYVTGRLNRLCKLLGVRVSLDDVEANLAAAGEVAVTSDDVTVRVYHTVSDEAVLHECIERLARRMALPARIFALIRVAEIPKTGSGKVCYAKLSATAPARARTYLQRVTS